MRPTDQSRAVWHSIVLMLLGADVLTGFLAQSIAYTFRFKTELLPPVAPMSSGIPILSLGVLILAMLINDLYNPKFAATAGLDEYRRVAVSATVASAAVVVIAFFVDAFTISRAYLVVSLAATTLLVGGGRFLIRRVLRWSWGRGLAFRRVLMVGGNAQAIQLAIDLNRESAAGARVVGLVDEYRPVGSTLKGFQVVGDPLGLADTVRQLHATHVIVVQSALSWEATRHVVDYLHRARDVEVLLAPGLHAVDAAPIDIVQLGSAPLLSPALTRVRGLEAWLKRGFELAVVLPVLVLTLPLQVAVIATLERYRRPAFEWTRVYGSGAREISLPGFAVSGWLRNHHLARLPSLWLVVTGRMSLIGPRPIRTGDVSGYERHRLVLDSLRPGFIGPWWLVRQGRPGAVEDEIELDLRYARSYTIWMDVRVLLRVAASLLGRAAGGEGAAAAEARARR